MEKAKKVIDYYILCNRLKNVIRTGWKNWKVSADRLESVAEHVYGVQMLAIHELGETIIGDITQFQIDKEEKEKIEHQAVHEILENLIDGEEIEKLFLEFDKHETKEAMFAYQCDKLECDIQSKLYDQYVDLNHQEGNDTANDSFVQEIMKEGGTFSDMWIKFGQRKYPYDENFMSVSQYVLKNKIK